MRPFFCTFSSCFPQVRGILFQSHFLAEYDPKISIYTNIKCGKYTRTNTLLILGWIFFIKRIVTLLMVQWHEIFFVNLFGSFYLYLNFFLLMLESRSLLWPFCNGHHKLLDSGKWAFDIETKKRDICYVIDIDNCFLINNVFT